MFLAVLSDSLRVFPVSPAHAGTCSGVVAQYSRAKKWTVFQIQPQPVNYTLDARICRGDTLKYRIIVPPPTRFLVLEKNFIPHRPPRIYFDSLPPIVKFEDFYN